MIMQAVSLYAGYDIYYQTHLSPCEKGGINRADTAERDEWGRFLPGDGSELPRPVDHGVAGGIKRAKNAKRDVNGQFVKVQ